MKIILEVLYLLLLFALIGKSILSFSLSEFTLFFSMQMIRCWIEVQKEWI